MKPIPATRLTMYLLHFDQPLGGKQHYLGSTFDGRLFQRMREHQRGHGGRFTRRFSQAGIGFTLAAAWTINRREDEAARKRTGHLARICPVCTAELPFTPRMTFKAEFAGLDGSAALDFSACCLREAGTSWA